MADDLQIESVIMYNSFGECVLEKHPSADIFSFEGTALPAGIYLLRINRTSSAKIIITE